MSGKWVWRFDGKLQCGLGTEETLESAEKQLASVIGKRNILSGSKRKAPVVTVSLCGAPVGDANAFELTDFGFWLLFHGIIGPIGFRPWVDKASGFDDDVGALPLPTDVGLTDTNVRFAGEAQSGNPFLISELYGRPCRCYEAGEPITKDFIRDRLNIVMDGGRVKLLWFG